MLKHSYILEEGNWKAEGFYYDHEANRVGVYGETTIRHLEHEWVLDGFMELKTENAVRFYNKYSIVPVPGNRDFTEWTSENPAIGRLNGRFMIIGDTILSSYTSEDGAYSGTECLVMVDGDKYLNRGFAFSGENKLSSWEVTVERL